MIINVCATKGGQCSNIVPDFSYHNSFLIADCKEVSTLTKDFMLRVGLFHCISQTIISLKPNLWGAWKAKDIWISYIFTYHIRLGSSRLRTNSGWRRELKKARETSPTAWVSLQSIENIILQYHYKVLRISFIDITTKYWEYQSSIWIQNIENILLQCHYEVLRISFFQYHYKVYHSSVALYQCLFILSRTPDREKVD